jgi:NAD(P)-dependent dehydrogenase (short-subunit alcohol dehydrogenase family)
LPALFRWFKVGARLAENAVMSETNTGPGHDSVVLVTAGASGIGACMAATFIDAGCRVHVIDIDRLGVEAFLERHPGATASVTDVGDPAGVESAFAEFQSLHDRLDVLINNAGIAGPVAPVEAIDPGDWQRTLDVDLGGAFYLTRLAVPLLKQRGGSIINIASNAGLHGVPLRSPYVAAKWALIGLTKTWAMELGDHGVRVNALCPGSVTGPRIDAVLQADAAERGVDVTELREVYAAQNSLRVFIDPQDVAAMAMLLTSPAGRHISGQAIGIDGHTETLSNRQL